MITNYKDKHEYISPFGVKSTVYLMDCMDFLAQCEPKSFALAVVDPPYGINFSDYERGGMGKKVKERYTKNEKKKWDDAIPLDKYFNDLFIMTRNQIIWGGNYFQLPATQCFLFWYKQNPVPNFADGEMAWTSFQKPAKCFDYRYYGNLQGNTSGGSKIHPTQKPVALYDWIYANYAKPTDTILDTHLGSGSSRIAADKAKLEFVGVELDSDYFYASVKRFEQYASQLKLF